MTDDLEFWRTAAKMAVVAIVTSTIYILLLRAAIKAARLAGENQKKLELVRESWRARTGPHDALTELEEYESDYHPFPKDAA